MSPRCLRLRPFVRFGSWDHVCLRLRLRLNIAFFFVFYVRLRSFSTFLGYFGVFLGILEYILPMFANVRLRSLFGMGIMFVFVFVSFRCHQGVFVFVRSFVLDHEIMFVFVFVSFRCHLGVFVFVRSFVLVFVFVFVLSRCHLGVFVRSSSSRCLGVFVFVFV